MNPVEDSLESFRSSGAMIALPRVRIAHISDLHFVSHWLLKRIHPKGLRGHNPDALEALGIALCEIRPDILFCTGDQSTWGDRSSLRAAHKYLRDLSQRCGVEESRVFVVPGNHDVLLHYYFGFSFARTNYEV